MSEERIDHMKYLPQMENIGSEIQDKVISEMENYDFAIYSRYKWQYF